MQLQLLQKIMWEKKYVFKIYKGTQYAYYNMNNMILINYS